MRYPHSFTHDAHTSDRHGCQHAEHGDRGGRRGSGHPKPHRGGRRHPALSRSIMRSARRIERAGLRPEQLHERIAGSVSHADYMTTMRTLRAIRHTLRSASPRR